MNASKSFKDFPRVIQRGLKRYKVVSEGFYGRFRRSQKTSGVFQRVSGAFHEVLGGLKRFLGHSSGVQGLQGVSGTFMGFQRCMWRSQAVSEGFHRRLKGFKGSPSGLSHSKTPGQPQGTPYFRCP